LYLSNQRLCFKRTRQYIDLLLANIVDLRLFTSVATGADGADTVASRASTLSPLPARTTAASDAGALLVITVASAGEDGRNEPMTYSFAQVRSSSHVSRSRESLRVIVCSHPIRSVL